MSDHHQPGQRSGWHAYSGYVLRRRLFALAVSTFVLAGCHIADSLFETTNTWWTCTWADNEEGLDSMFCRTDDADFNWYSFNLRPSARAVLDQMLEREFEPTDLTVSQVANPVYSGPSETDAIFYWTVMPAALRGYTWCESAADISRCDQHYVALSMGPHPAIAHDPSEYTMCHEAGHAVGLTHGAEASPTAPQDDAELECLRSGLPSYPYAGILGLHNQNQINVAY